MPAASSSPPPPRLAPSPAVSGAASTDSPPRRWLARLTEALGEPTDGAFLGVFRAAIGLVLTISFVRFLALGWVDELLVQPRMLFTFWGFGFVRPLPSGALHALFGALVVLAACFTLGLFFRATAALLLLGFVYIQLLDVTNYLNHYVLLGLLVGWLAFTPAGRIWSLDGWRRSGRCREPAVVPRWTLWILRVQVGAVYFHAGLAKLDTDWLLHGQPLGLWLASRWELPLVGPMLRLPGAALGMSWAGFLFDTTIPLWLSWARTRPLAYAAVVVFHVMTSALFPIGLFPLIMMVAAVVFFPPERFRAVLDRLRERGRGEPVAPAVQMSSRALPPWSALLFVGFVAIQALLPLRSWLYGGNVRWHEQGMRFAWKVMVREKNGSVTYRVTEPLTGKIREVPPRAYLTPRQERDFSTQPDLILQLAHRIADDYTRDGRRPEVHVDAIASLNGRPAARLIDPSVDLAKVADGLGKASWILSAPEGPPPRLVRPGR
jgi:vitamin K-dependent gamma-carboxylase